MFNVKKLGRESSSQDDGVGRQGLPLHTTATKLQLEYRTTITQNQQKWN